MAGMFVITDLHHGDAQEKRRKDLCSRAVRDREVRLLPDDDRNEPQRANESSPYLQDLVLPVMMADDFAVQVEQLDHFQNLVSVSTGQEYGAAERFQFRDNRREKWDMR